MNRLLGTTTWLSLILLISAATHSFANSGITYHGRLMGPDGTPVTATNVQFRLQIRTPGTQDCLMYEELQTHNLSTTNGLFAISLGDTTGVRQDANAWSLFDSMSNRKAFTFNPGDCAGVNNYTPNQDDNRKFRVSFNDGSFVGWETLPTQSINFIPMAIEAFGVGGFTANSLLRVENAGTLGNISPLTTPQYNEILALIAGTSTLYTRAGQLNGSALPAIGSGESVRWNGTAWQAFTPLTAETDPSVQAFAKASLPTCTATQVLTSDGTTLSCKTDADSGGGGWTAVDATDSVKGIVAVPTLGGLEVTAGEIGLPDVVVGDTFTKVTVDDKGRVTSGADITGADIQSGTIGGSTSISTTGTISASGGISTRQFDLYDSDNTNFIAIRTPATGDLTANYTLTLPPVLGTANQILGMNAAGTALENKSITAGANITINHTANGIEIVGSAGGGGTVTSVSGTAPVQVATGTTTPVISVDDATAAAKGIVQIGVGLDVTTGVVSLPDVITGASFGSATEVPVLTVDDKGRVTAVTNTAINNSPVGSTLAEGQTFMGDSSNDAQARFIYTADIRSSIAPYNPVFPTSCGADDTLTWSVITDVFTCTPIAIDASQVANLPADLWSTDGTDVYRTTGEVGIGTNSPSASLDVRGNMLVRNSGTVPFQLERTDANNNLAPSMNLIRMRSDTTAPAAGFGGYIGMKLEGFTNGTAVNAGSLNWGWETTQSDDTTTRNSFISFRTLASNTNENLYGDERMRISSIGNVGIGTNNPGQKLHVVGTSGNTLRIVDGNQAVGRVLTSDANGVASWAAPSGGGATGDFMADGSVPMTGQFLAANGTSGAPGISFASSPNTGIRPIGTNELAMTVNGNDTIWFLQGYTSIRQPFLVYTSPGGTYSPTSTTQHQPNMAMTRVQSSSGGTDNAAGLEMIAWNSTNEQNAYVAVAASPAGSAPNIVMGQRTGANAYAERLRINPSGFLGIGTTDPTALFDVNGQIRIRGGVPGVGKVLTSDANGLATWETPSAGGGTVTSVSGTAPIQVNTGTTTPVVSVDDATTTTKGVVQVGTGLSVTTGTIFLPNVGSAGTYGSATQVPVLTTDTQGRVTGVTNTTITGTSPIGSSLNQNQVFIGNGTNVVEARFFSAADLRTSIGTQQIPSSCTSAQTMTWSAITDAFTCVNIAIDSSQVANLPLGDVGGPASSTDKAIARYDGTTGKLLQNSSVTIDDFGNVNTSSITSQPHGTAIGETGRVLFRELAANGTNSAIIRAPDALTADYSLTLPSALGLNGQVLTTNASGILSWTTPSSGAGDVVGPPSSTDNAVARFDSTTGKIIQNSSVIIDDSGNVGIGASPVATTRLTVQGSLASAYVSSSATLPFPTGASQVIANSSFTTSTLAVLRLSTKLGSQNAYIGAVANASGETPVLVIGQQTGAAAYAERIRIDATGNVGIGTTTPPSLLAVEGVISVRETIAPTATANYGKIYVKSADSKLYFMNDSGIEIELGAGASSQWSDGTGSINYMAGSVGIGTATPTSELHVVGAIRADEYITTSDRRLKSKIEEIEGLEIIRKIKAVRYTRDATGKTEYGLIAQEVEEVLPELVTTEKHSGLKAVNYQGLISPIIQSVQELDQRCEMDKAQMKKEITALRNELNELRNLIERHIAKERK